MNAWWAYNIATYAGDLPPAPIQCPFGIGFTRAAEDHLGAKCCSPSTADRKSRRDVVAHPPRVEVFFRYVAVIAVHNEKVAGTASYADVRVRYEGPPSPYLIGV